jgi:hypothetical protein
MLKEKLPFVLINTLLLHIPLLALTDGQNDRQRDEYTRCAWAGGTIFQLCCCVSSWLRREIVLDATHLPYQLCRCVFFWLWQEIVLGCTDRSVFLLWQEKPKQSAQKYCGASSRQISDNCLSCQNTNTTNQTLI